MQKNSLQIALALSGGGIRAAIYHLGVLEFLAKHNLLEQVKHISSVSGGSMCMGLVYAKNGFSFPTSKQYLESVLPAAKEAILNTNIEKSAILRAVFGFKLFSKANAIAEALEKLWGINADFSKLPNPRYGRYKRQTTTAASDFASHKSKSAIMPMALCAILASLYLTQWLQVRHFPFLSVR